MLQLYMQMPVIQSKLVTFEGMERIKRKVGSKQGGVVEDPKMIWWIEYFYSPLWKLPSEVVCIVLLSITAVSPYLRRYIYYLKFSWKISNICKRGENSIMNYYVLINKLQQLWIHIQSCFMCSWPISSTLDYLESNLRYHIISFIIFKFWITKR